MKIINVMAVSLDGKIAVHSQESDQDRRRYGFTNKVDQEHVRSLILGADAIITGANSMRASGGAWEQPNRHGKMPLWVVMTSKGLDPSLRFWKQAQIPRWIVSPQPLSSESQDSGVAHKVAGGAPVAKYVYDKLAALNLDTVLLFGGGAVNALFYEAGLVDELKITLCPIIVGGVHASNFVDPRLTHPHALRLVASQVVESHVFLNYQTVK